MARCRIITGIIAASSNLKRVGKRQPVLIKDRLSYVIKKRENAKN